MNLFRSEIKTSHITNSLNRSPLRRGLVLIALAFACFGLSPMVQAVCQEGCLSNYNTVLGDDALINLATGSNNTAMGFQALHDDTGGFDNTAVGYKALLSNTTGYGNTATGIFALSNNTTGIANTATGDGALSQNTDGTYNTATGALALVSNTTGNDNTATGHDALSHNRTGSNNTATGSAALINNTGNFNTATGFDALADNTTGSDNTANGVHALSSNTTGNRNTANGGSALRSNTTGGFNTATGFEALFRNSTATRNTANGYAALHNNTTGFSNTANGFQALFNNTIGSGNIAVGLSAGANLTTGSNNIDIGARGVAGEANTIRIGTVGTYTATFIAGIFGLPVTDGVAVFVNGAGRLGTGTSSERFKDEIKPMDKASEVILALKPVTFRYKKNLDPAGTPHFGLVAEQVEKVNPHLVVRDEQGKPYTVRYEAVNAMLLNEFLKEHRRVEEQEATISELKNAMKAIVARLKDQDSKIQKVSDQVEVNRPAPQIVLNNP
jgi:hypothetical protein